MRSAKNTVFEFGKATLRRLGFNLSFDYPYRNPNKLLVVKCAEFGVNTVLDVGANCGQFAAGLRSSGYCGQIVSFEPLSAVHESLTRAAFHDRNWIVMPRMALGDTVGTLQMNVSDNLVSSSLLQVRQRSVDAAPGSAFVGTDEVSVNLLDDVIDEAWSKPFVLKLDTQGFELNVLRGAPETLKMTTVVITELSLSPLYAGGASFADVFRFLEERDFRCISLFEGFVDRASNEVLQVDGVFVRNTPISI